MKDRARSPLSFITCGPGKPLCDLPRLDYRLKQRLHRSPRVGSP